MNRSISRVCLLGVVALGGAAVSGQVQPLQTNAGSSIRVAFIPSGPATITGGTFWHYNHAWFDGAIAPDTGAVDPADQPDGYGMLRYDGLDGQRRIINRADAGPVLVNRRRIDYAPNAFPAGEVGSSTSAGKERRITAGDYLYFSPRPWDPPGTLIGATLGGGTDIHTDDTDVGTVAHAFARPSFVLSGTGDGWRQGSMSVEFSAYAIRNTRHPDCAASLDAMASLTVRGLDEDGGELWTERLFDLRLFQTLISTQDSGFGHMSIDSVGYMFSEDLSVGFVDVDMRSGFIAPDDRGRFLWRPFAPLIADGVFAGGMPGRDFTFDYQLPFAASYEFELAAGVPAPGTIGVVLLAFAGASCRSRRTH